MTTANIVNFSKGQSVTPVKTGSPNDLTKKAEDVAAAMFGSLMNQFGSSRSMNAAGNSAGTEPVSEMKVAGAGSSDPYSGRSANIAQARPDTVRDRIASAGEQAVETGRQIVRQVSEQMDVSPEEVEQVLESLGMSVFDLMNPQNLGTFVMELTQAEDSVSLLMDPKLQNLLQEIGQLGDDLIRSLDLKPEQMDELIAQMDILETPEELSTETFAQILGEHVPGQTQTESAEQGLPAREEVILPSSKNDPAVEVQKNEQPSLGSPMTEEVQDGIAPGENSVLPQQPQGEQPEQEEAQSVLLVRTEEPQKEMQVSPGQRELRQEAAETRQNPAEITTEQTDVQTVNIRQEAQETETEPMEDTETLVERLLQDRGDTEDTQGQTASEDSRQNDSPQQMKSLGFSRQIHTEAGIAAEGVQPEFSVSDVVQTAIQPETTGYASVSTVEIIHQIVENMRSEIQNGVSSLEMQLNPENLGKVLVHLTSREGTVNAQFMASSEAVRAALESQIATLRENMNQAGIKVDAIEVAVGTHEFEQNLEQNARGEAEQERRSRQERQGRRNLSLDSLDELSGLMTEEERLAAQIMQDNGNSMDVTA